MNRSFRLKHTHDRSGRLFVVIEKIAEVLLLATISLWLTRSGGGSLTIIVVGQSAWSFLSSIFRRSLFNQTTQFVGQGIFIWHDGTRRSKPFTALWNWIANTVSASFNKQVQHLL